MAWTHNQDHSRNADKQMIKFSGSTTDMKEQNLLSEKKDGELYQDYMTRSPIRGEFMYKNL